VRFLRGRKEAPAGCCREYARRAVVERFVPTLAGFLCLDSLDYIRESEKTCIDCHKGIPHHLPKRSDEKSEKTG
jgi:hypothetical protein